MVHFFVHTYIFFVTIFILIIIAQADAENSFQRFVRRFIPDFSSRFSQNLLARYPQAKNTHVITTSRTRISLPTFTKTDHLVAQKTDHVMVPTVAQTTLDTSSPVSSNENTSTSYNTSVPPISAESSNDQNDNSSTKYIIIGVSATIGIILIVSLVFIFKKLRANRRLKNKSVHARGGNLDQEFGNENFDRIRNVSHSSQQGVNYMNGSIQSYNASNGNESFNQSYQVSYPARSHYKDSYPIRSDYSNRSGGSPPTDSNYNGHTGGSGQGYHPQHYNAQLVTPNQYYNPDPNFVVTNFLPPGSIDRRMIRENILEIANDEDDTHESLRNYSMTESNTLFVPSVRESEQESLGLPIISENSRTSPPVDNRSQTNQRAVYF
ncbi:21072_t:CDS:2 [Cetraspora pellucida]|uniref:21072_t:CDS:1 n=1 Tax=Cetraspora pellucida TaxID=1433469 RepID=A0A9N9IRC1_9GLOM|nr:21072_t:CDS:2 [Cetraspora pellucida]